MLPNIFKIKIKKKNQFFPYTHKVHTKAEQSHTKKSSSDLSNQGSEKKDTMGINSCMFK